MYLEREIWSLLIFLLRLNGNFNGSVLVGVPHYISLHNMTALELITFFDNASFWHLVQFHQT